MADGPGAVGKSRSSTPPAGSGPFMPQPCCPRRSACRREALANGKFDRSVEASQLTLAAWQHCIYVDGQQAGCLPAAVPRQLLTLVTPH